MVIVYWTLRHLSLVLVLIAIFYGWLARDNLTGWLGLDKHPPASHEAPSLDH